MIATADSVTTIPDLVTATADSLTATVDLVTAIPELVTATADSLTAVRWAVAQLSSGMTQFLPRGYAIRTVQELLGHRNVHATLIYTHVLNRGGRGVLSSVVALG